MSSKTLKSRYKLKTRAGYFLGKNPEERMGILAKVDHFYDARSAIAHGPRKKGPNISFEDALSDGFGLARKTLLKLFCGGMPPDLEPFRDVGRRMQTSNLTFLVVPGSTWHLCVV